MVLLVAAFLIMTIFVLTFISQTNYVKATARELEVLKAINVVELTKRNLNQAGTYSINQAFYNIAQKGGFSKFDNLASFNCIPYWSVYNSDFSPKSFEGNLKEEILKIIKLYSSKLSDSELQAPEFDTIDFEKKDSSLAITISSKRDIKYETNLVKVEEKSKFIFEKNSKIFRLFEIANEIKKNIVDIVNSANNYQDLQAKLQDTSGSLTSDYSADDVQINLQPEKIGAEEESFIARVLVSISDKSENLVYDYFEKTTNTRPLNFKFFVIGGKEIIQLPIDRCEFS